MGRYFSKVKIESKIKSNAISRHYMVLYEDMWIDVFFNGEVNERLFKIIACKDDNLTVDMLKHIHKDKRLEKILNKYYDSVGWLSLPKDRKVIRECHEVIMAFIRRLNAQGVSVSWVWEEKIIDLTIPPTERKKRA